MNDDLVAMLERERMGGMPRWNVRSYIDTPEDIMRRRMELLTAEADWRTAHSVQVVRARQPLAEEGAA